MAAAEMAFENATRETIEDLDLLRTRVHKLVARKDTTAKERWDCVREREIDVASACDVIMRKMPARIRKMSQAQLSNVSGDIDVLADRAHGGEVGARAGGGGRSTMGEALKSQLLGLLEDTNVRRVIVNRHFRERQLSLLCRHSYD